MRKGLLLLLLVSVPGVSIAAAQGGTATERPRPLAVKLPTVVNWLLNSAGPCPNCDAAQTWVGRKPTPLFSPLPARRASTPYPGSSVAPEPAAPPNPLDQLAWERVHVLLPAGLRR
jgi:hypothetical protein